MALGDGFVELLKEETGASSLQEIMRAILPKNALQDIGDRALTFEKNKKKWIDFSGTLWENTRHNYDIFLNRQKVGTLALHFRKTRSKNAKKDYVFTGLEYECVIKHNYYNIEDSRKMLGRV